MQKKGSKPVVFISYSHDSDEHSGLVRGLGSSLARDGCDCRLDVHKASGEDWPTWMTRQLREADFVLCVTTRTYARRFKDQEPHDVGKGVGWEAGLIRRLLYARKLHNNRIFPIFFKSPDKKYIPLELDGYDFFLLDGLPGYEALLRKIHGKPRYERPISGPAPDLPTEPNQPLFSPPGSTVPAEQVGALPAETDDMSPDPIDEDIRKTLQERQFDPMVKAIGKNKDALDALADSLYGFSVGEVQADNTDALIPIFNTLTNNEGTECIAQAYSRVCRKKNLDAAVAIGDFAEAWLPVIFEHHDQISQIRPELSDPKTATVSVPTKLALPTEIMMAEAEKGLAKLELSARNELVSRFDLGGLGELGLDEDGKEQQRQLYELLHRRFLNAEDRPGFERTVHSLVSAIGNNHDNLGALHPGDDPEALKNKLAGILSDLFDFIGRRFYCRVEIGKGLDPGVFENLRAQYPTLAFLVSSCTDTKKEFERYRKLSSIIATAKGDTKLYEEIAKNA